MNRLAADTWTLTQRDLRHWVAQPTPVVIGLLFPVMTVLMFGFLFGGALSVPGGGNYREFLMPGMFALTMVFSMESTMAAVVTDAQRGVTDRFRSMPMASSAVLLGRSCADMLNAAVGLVVLVVCGLLVGWRSNGSFGATVLAFALLLLLRFALIWVGIYLGLLMNGPEALAAAQILVWPLGFLSSAFVSPDTMPGWLGTVAEWNPLSATVAATRTLFGNPGVGTSWAAENAAVFAVVWPILLVVIFLPLSVRRYRALSH
ncbi:ABC transporter permease [Allokutzneria sp. A3M-2-11 16]|uniref:ABC transporter permease n=1 Tax=Allokutzneria sp. A3M-2-11 16 TaxID=2962043 RepID=UPI0020B8B12C|nr:ABC transporter permease [Allokutzneria sp. A3M-2-11 16]MCP3805274.1 ABC transporter permease [Allokutzneria sp. A3M-2-11 16]